MKNANATNRPPVQNPNQNTQNRPRTRVQAQGASIARREAAASARRAVPTPQRSTPAAPALRNLPVSAPRLVAVAALVLLLLVTLIGPGAGASVPDTSALLTPGIDGTNAVSGAVDTGAVEDELFRYRTVIERNQGPDPAIPSNIADVLHYSPDSVRARKTIIGQMYAGTGGNLDQAIVDSGLFSNLDEQKLSDMETAYRSFLYDEQRGTKAINGLSVMSLIRSLSTSGDQRNYIEQTAISGFQQALDTDPSTWQFTYNYALANLMVGNYSTAYEAMRGITSKVDADNNKLSPFWMGVAALRMGDPGEAKVQFQKGIDTKVEGGNDAYQQMLANVRELSREGFADAQWANQETGAAYDSYFQILANSNTDDMGLYTKWVTLGLQQRAYERLASDMASLESGSGFSKSPRIHHDRARLLTFLGRTGEAQNEYNQALQIGENDPSLLISYGQFLESTGDHNGALSQADAALRGLGKDPSSNSSDLTSVAHSVVLSTSNYVDLYNGQQLLDANLLRARAWGNSGKASEAATLAGNIALGAAKAPADEAGLIDLYAGLAAEAGNSNDKAVSYYDAAWGKLKSLPTGTQGRAAALAGLARATAKTKDAAAGVSVLAGNGYDPAAPRQPMTVDTDAPDLLYQGALLLQQEGKRPEAANALRVSSILRNTQNARTLDGVGRPLWEYSGFPVPANAALLAANSANDIPGSNELGLTAMRYSQVFLLDPAMAAAWNNLGVAYAKAGNSSLANHYLQASDTISPDYSLGAHNQAALQYQGGIGNFFNAEAAQANAIKAAGPGSLFWGNNLRADDRGPLPAPLNWNSDFLSRLPAILIVLLLLAHTLVGNDRLTNRMGLLPTKGVLGMLAAQVDSYVKRLFPGLTKPGSDSRTLAITVGVPSIIGMLALAFGAGHGSLAVALVYLPVALLASLIAFAAHQLAQRWEARRHHGSTVYHLWPFGAILGIIAIPFGFLYGWQVVSRVQPATVPADGTPDGKSARRSRTGEEADLEYEAQAEALAELSADDARARVGTPVASAAPAGGLLNLSPAASILFAGLAANLLLVIVFGAAYWLTAWPSLRLAMYASALVLAFTAVSEPPAEGWTLYRRNAPLWMALFVLAAAVATLLAVGIM